MALTKARIIDKLIESNGHTAKNARFTLETTLEIIKGTLESGEDVLITGFGKFQVKEKGERKGVRDITAGKDLILPPRRVVTFKCSGKLRELVNRG